MTRREITLECDPCGHPPASGEVVERHTFALNGQAYETDMCVRHAGRFNLDMAPWTAHALRGPGRRTRGAASGEDGPRRSAADRRRAEELRAWWKRHPEFGPWSRRGRIPARVGAAFERARD